MGKRAVVKAYARVIEWASVLAGIAIIGSCTSIGYRSGGLWGGLASFALTFVVAALLVGAVFLVTMMSGDLMEVRAKMKTDALRPGGEDVVTNGPATPPSAE
jgi:hypothetical protein